MKEIIEKSRDLTKVEIYKLTSSNSTQSIKNFENQIIEVDYWAKFTDTDDATGTVTEILSIATKDGEYIATNSIVVIRSFDEMAEVFGNEIPPIQIITGKSKNNRTYYNIRLA